MKPIAKSCLYASIVGLVACGTEPPVTSSSSSVPSSSSSVVSTSSSSSSAASSASGANSMILAINVGGFSEATVAGVKYGPDRFATGGTTGSTTDAIAGTTDDALFQTERYGSYGYKIPVTAGTYSVELQFVEMYHEVAGGRSFNLSVEGSTEMSNVDLYSLVGHDGAYTYSVEGVRVTDGELNIDLESLVDNGTMSGFAIYSSDGAFVEPPIPEPSPNGGKSDEDTGGDCPIAALPSAGQLPSIPKLPDPFKKLDGTRMTTKAEWRCRRAEINAQVQKYESGIKPPKPASVTGSVTNSSISVTVQENGKSINFSATITLPSNGQAPYPAMIGVGGSNLSNLTSKGIAVINFNNNEMGAQSGGGSRGTGKFFDLYGSNHTASSMTAWAWGVSRLVDVIASSNGSIIDHTRLGVTGCSRNGKGALMVGALDERIALTVPQESGAGGSAAWRVAQQLNDRGVETQTLSSAAGEQPWFTASFGSTFGSSSNVTKLPFDHHEVMAMVAPRGLLVIDNDIGWLGPLPGFVATSAAKEVYKALGAGDNIAYVEDGGHTHCSFPSNQQAVLDAYLQKFLLNGSGNTNVMRSTKGNASNVSEWVDWTTPSLQ